MRTFSLTTDLILSPPERVWAAMSDPERWHEWTASISGARKLTDGPLAVGSRFVVRQPKFPPAMWRVTAVAPGVGFTWVSVAPGLRVVAHHVITVEPAGCRATLALEMQGPLGGLWGWLTRGITARYLALEGAGLKARCEGPEFREGHAAPSLSPSAG